MREQHFSFQNANQTLYGMLHVPDGDGPFPAVLMLHGFTTGRNQPHFIFVKAARALARAGFVAMRFDFRGSGESEGEFVDVTIEGEISDALVALAWLRTRPEVDAARVGVLGFSVGGCVAACVAGRDGQLPALALWSAIADPMRLFTGLGGEVKRDVPVPVPSGLDVGGLIVGHALISELSALQPVQEIKTHLGRVLLIHATDDATALPFHAQLYADALGERADLQWIEGADHTFSRTWWEQDVFERTTRYFESTLLPA